MLQGYLHAALRSPGIDAPGEINATGRIVCNERGVDRRTAPDIVMYRNAYACTNLSRSQSPSTSASPCSRASPCQMQQQKLTSGRVCASACTLDIYLHSMAAYMGFENRRTQIIVAPVGPLTVPVQPLSTCLMLITDSLCQLLVQGIHQMS